MEIFKEIKVKNEALKINTYNQFQKQTSGAQCRLLSAFDLIKGKMQMEFLQAQVPQPKTASDYKNIVFEFDVKEIHPIDQMEMHKQTREMIFYTITNTTMNLSKLQVTLATVQSQPKMEKVSALAKDTRIKTLEDLAIKLGYDLANINVAEELVKKKNLDMATLRKQLKLPAIEDPLAKDIEETGTQKANMMKLNIEQNAQLKKMETKMENLIKEKEKATKNTTPLEALPITVIPTSISTTTSRGDVVNQLSNAVQNMSFQTEEIKKLQDQVKLLEDHQKKYEIFNATEIQRAQNQIEVWKKSTVEPSIGHTLVHVKEIIWNNIIEEIDEIQPCIQIIFQQKELMENAKQTIANINAQLGEMPATTNNKVPQLQEQI